MAYRGGRMDDFDDVEVRERHRRVSRSPPPRRSVSRRREYDDVEVRVRERESERSYPTFLREEVRRPEAGALVLRQRDVETFERPRHRSPSPVFRERIVRRARSLTPPHDEYHERERIRTVERERVRSPSRGPSRERVRTKFVSRSSSSSSPSPVRMVRRRRSSSPAEREHEHIRIVERERERRPSPSRSPPAPPVIRGPVIEREVITHYTDVDHGMVKVRKPSPEPPSRNRGKDRELDIDIHTSRDNLEVDIHRHSRSRSTSRDRRRKEVYRDDVRDTDLLRVHQHSRRRAHSAAPLPTPLREEAEYITSRIDSRGRIGEAHNGATKGWTIVDVPPGTKRVRMDGAGGASADVTWQRYSGVRRTKFIPDRDGAVITTARPETSRRGGRDKLSVSIYDGDKEIEVEKVKDRRVTLRPAPIPSSDMWTEITKDLVNREAVERMGYDYEETEFFFYIMKYLRYEDVLELVELTEDIRRRRARHKHHHWDKHYTDDFHVHRHRHRHPHHHPYVIEDSRYREHEVVIDREARYRK